MPVGCLLGRQIPGEMGTLGIDWVKHFTLFVYVRKISKSLSNNKAISRNSVVSNPSKKVKTQKGSSHN